MSGDDGTDSQVAASGDDEPLGRLTRLLPVAILVAAACLFASELMTMFEFRPPGGESLCAQDAGDRHSNAQMLIAGFAVLATFGAVFLGSRPAAYAVAAMGILALLIFLISDLRVVNAAGSLDESCGAGQGFLFEAEAIPQGGFYMELAGALALAVSGVALATLTPAQLVSLRPSRRSRPDAGAGDDSDETAVGEPEQGVGRSDEAPKRRLRRRPRARQRAE